MRQRYTIDLERVPIQKRTVTVVACDLIEAQDKALAHMRAHPEEWVEDHCLSDARVIKVIERIVGALSRPLCDIPSCQADSPFR